MFRSHRSFWRSTDSSRGIRQSDQSAWHTVLHRIRFTSADLMPGQSELPLRLEPAWVRSGGAAARARQEAVALSYRGGAETFEHRIPRRHYHALVTAHRTGPPSRRYHGDITSRRNTDSLGASCLLESPRLSARDTCQRLRQLRTRPTPSDT